MDFKDLFEVSQAHIRQYTAMLLSALARPSSLGQVETPSDGTVKEPVGVGLDVFIFAAVNLALGATFSALFPYRPAPREIAIVMVVLLIFWCFLSLLTHSLCRSFGGSGTLNATVAAGLKTFSFVYLVSDFLAFIWLALIKEYHVLVDALGILGFVFASWRVVFLLQLVLMLVYLPPVLRKVHGLRGFLGVVASTLAPAFTVLLGMPIFMIGGC